MIKQIIVLLKRTTLFWLTAPSKRIKKIIPEYNKVSAGCNIAMQISLAKIRNENHHFNEWLNKLEQLA